MSHITLIRHGQANSAATDEKSYDQLSALGHQQAGWLGAYLSETATHHTRFYTGTLNRHRQTASAMQTDLHPIQDERLNELAYFTLSQLLTDQHGIPFPDDEMTFADHLPLVFSHWRDGKIEGAPETWGEFQLRTQEALKEIGLGQGPALIVTSGGFISMVMAQAMELSIPAMARLAMSIMHTSMHRMFPVAGHWSPVLFNAVPHLDIPERRMAQTHI
ncbi:MAG: histidine phosphatase family protein [Pseudomonadota bacterium]